MVLIHLSVSVLEVTILEWSWAYFTHPGFLGIIFLRNINFHRRHNHNANLEFCGVCWSPDANEFSGIYTFARIRRPTCNKQKSISMMTPDSSLRRYVTAALFLHRRPLVLGGIGIFLISIYSNKSVKWICGIRMLRAHIKKAMWRCLQ